MNRECTLITVDPLTGACFEAKTTLIRRYIQLHYRKQLFADKLGTCPVVEIALDLKVEIQQPDVFAFTDPSKKPMQTIALQSELWAKHHFDAISESKNQIPCLDPVVNHYHQGRLAYIRYSVIVPSLVTTFLIILVLIPIIDANPSGIASLFLFNTW